MHVLLEQLSDLIKTPSKCKWLGKNVKCIKYSYYRNIFCIKTEIFNHQCI